MKAIIFVFVLMGVTLNSWAVEPIRHPNCKIILKKSGVPIFKGDPDDQCDLPHNYQWMLRTFSDKGYQPELFLDEDDSDLDSDHDSDNDQNDPYRQSKDKNEDDDEDESKTLSESEIEKANSSDFEEVLSSVNGSKRHFLRINPLIADFRTRDKDFEMGSVIFYADQTAKLKYLTSFEFDRREGRQGGFDELIPACVRTGKRYVTSGQRMAEDVSHHSPPAYQDPAVSDVKGAPGGPSERKEH